MMATTTKRYARIYSAGSHFENLRAQIGRGGVRTTWPVLLDQNALSEPAPFLRFTRCVIGLKIQILPVVIMALGVNSHKVVLSG